MIILLPRKSFICCSAACLLCFLDAEQGFHHVIDRGQEFCRGLKAVLVTNEVDHFLFQGNSVFAVTQVVQLGQGIRIAFLGQVVAAGFAPFLARQKSR